MKYFNPSYWFNLWLLSAPLFNDQTKGINAKSINNKKINDWVSKNTTNLDLVNEQLNFTSNNQTNFSTINNTTNKELSTVTHKYNPEIISRRQNYDSKKQIEFINQNFFYKFNINENQYVEGQFGSFSGGYHSIKSFNKVLIKNWTNYAKDWDEFERKFPWLEFINFKAESGGQGITQKIDNLKISTFLYKDFENWNSEFTEQDKINIFKNILAGRYFDGPCDTKPAIGLKCYNVNPLVYSNFNFYAHQYASSSLRIYPNSEKLMIETFYDLYSSNAIYKPWGSIKYDSVRLVGEVDLNPLLRLTLEQSKNIENWYKRELEVLNYMRGNPNHDERELMLKDEALTAELMLWITQLRTDFIQNLVIIEHDNQILELKKEIDDIKERLNNLEKGEDCIKGIVTEFRKRETNAAIATPIEKFIKKSPANMIAKATVNALKVMTIQSAVVSLFNCILVWATSRRKINFCNNNNISSKQKIKTFDIISDIISDINNLKIKNKSENWTDNFTKSINNEQYLAIENKTNFATTNITSL